MDVPTCTIDDFGPIPLLAVGSAAELGDIVRQAATQGEAVYPLGGRTFLHLGRPPTRSGRAVDLRRLNQIIDYPARDMTVTVQAGMSVAALQQLLASERQRLPVDVPCAAQATLGGALAVNASGPRRLGFGTFRDYVIGITVVNDQGHEAKAGGRVVKNVAGYDLCKLHIGALGTLGIITQVTFKVRPLPEQQALVLVGCGTATLPTLLDQLHASRSRPIAVDVLNAPAARLVLGSEPSLPWLVVVGFEDHAEVVRWQVDRLGQELACCPEYHPEVIDGPAGTAVWKGLVDFVARPEPVMTFKANLLPHAVAAFCRETNDLLEQPLIQAHAGSGIVIGHVVGDLTLERAGPMLTMLRTAATGAGGNLIVVRCPPSWKASLPVWGAPRGDGWLMRQVKKALDPHHVFNPGRFLDGI
ncbi:MAG: FAD-binding oxidoreductase [Gemmataceae bacterium]|nr:FAD-binding oxidoreductase [Gemmataceae bacterium]MDW8266120.1 FAD-binding oxidoreductase [Gemmataceae bacterium]